MKTKNLLVNIQSYAPHARRNPKENFFTEVFAHLIDQDRRLLKEFLNLIRENLDDERKNKLDDFLLDVNECEEYEVKTQSPCSGKQIDLEIKCESKNFCLFIENKLDAELGEGQLENYLSIWERIWECRNNGLGGVVLITHYCEELPEDIENDPYFLGHLYWGYDIYTRFSGKCEEGYKAKTETINAYLLKQFLEFMESEKMEPIKIEKGDKAEVIRCMKILEWIDTLLGDITKKTEGKYKMGWSSLKKRPNFRFHSGESNNICYDLQFDIDVNDRKLTPTLYVQLELVDPNDKKYISKRDDSEKIREFLENKVEWGNPFKLDDDGRWLGRSFKMDDEFYGQSPSDQRNKIITFFMKTLDKLAEAGLVERR